MFTRIAVGLSRVFALSALAFFVSGSGGCGAIIRSNVETQPRVALAAADYDQPSRIVRGDAVAYAPKTADAGASDIDPDLQRFAPVIVQGFQPADAKRKYDVDDDAIGSPNLTREGDSVRIDVSQPAVYCRVEQADVDGHALKQLVYVFWYPCRPVGSIEKGDVDGGILRLTLDAAGRPSVFEYSQPCGCFHGVFVADTLEASAAAEFASLAPNRVHAVEPPLTGKDDWVVRDLVHVSDSIADASARPILYMSAGKHFCEAMAFGPASSIGELHASRSYEMRAYDALEHIARDGGGVGSMFNERGLVLGGKRGGEELLLSDLDNPGWPRHLDRMKIDWDQAQWTDPSLLATHLRLPTGVADARASVDVSAVKGPKAQALADDGPTFAAEPGTYGTLLLFTNRSCLGCMAMKRDVLPDARIKKAMGHWTLRTFDTATPEGAALAATHRVTATPTMIALDVGGRERSRSEDLLSVEDMLAAIPREPK